MSKNIGVIVKFCVILIILGIYYSFYGLSKINTI